MNRRIVFGMTLAIAPTLIPTVQAQVFDKPITITVAGTAGGGIDLAARAVARHLGDHLAGKPSVVAQDMPGAGGIRAGAYLAVNAPKDGTAIATFAGGPIIEPLIGPRDPGYDMSRFNWIGALTKDVGLCVVMASTPFKTLDDMRKHEMIVAGTGAGSDTDTYPVVLNALLGTKMRVITGYLGTKETALAMENGEAQGRCSFPISALKLSRPDWIRDKKINVLLQIGPEKSSEFPDAPLASDLVTSDADRELLNLLSASKAITLPYALPPGVPPARVEALRRGFAETMRDPSFLAEAKQIQLDVAPSTGEATQAVVERIYATPPAVVARAKTLLNAKD